MLANPSKDENEPDDAFRGSYCGTKSHAEGLSEVVLDPDDEHDIEDAADAKDVVLDVDGTRREATTGYEDGKNLLG